MLIGKRAIKIVELSEELDQAKKIITEFVWPSDMDEKQRQRYLIKCAKFAGCSIPKFGNSLPEQVMNKNEHE